jgi:hypothetical protein
LVAFTNLFLWHIVSASADPAPDPLDRQLFGNEQDMHHRLPMHRPHFEESFHGALNRQTVLIGGPICSHAIYHRARQQSFNSIPLLGGRLLCAAKVG